MTELRRRRRPRTAFVLGGGGNLGAIQIGMLRALLERGESPDLVIGCSVGAVNGVALANSPGLDGIAALEAIWLDPDTWAVLGGRLTPMSLFRRAPSMVGSDKLRSMLESHFGDRHLDELDVPVHVVATSLLSGRERWFSTGPIVPAVLASSALPAILPPVDHDGDLLIDGGVVNQVPISQAIALGAERIVVLHVGNFNRPRTRPKRPIDVLLQSFSIARNHRFAFEHETASGVDMVVLPSIDPGSLRRNDFSRSSELMKRAHAAAGAFLDDLRPAAGGRA